MSYKIDVMGFVDGQEPDDLDDDWAAQIKVEIVVEEQDLARLLGVQQRVLVDRLRDTTKQKLFNSLDKMPKEIEKKVFSKISNYVQMIAREDYGLSGSVQDISLSDNTEYWDVIVTPHQKAANFQVEYDVLGRWEGPA